MEKKTLIDKVKAMFSEVEKSKDEEVKMVYYTTKEGIEVKIPEGTELVEGTPVTVVGEDGSEIPAPAGEHEIEGKVVTVDEAGIIVSVVDAPVEDAEVEAPAAPAEEEMASEEEEMVEVEVETPEDAVVEEDKVSELEARIASLEALVANMAENMSAIDVLEEKFSKLADSPADEEVKLSKATSTKVSKEGNFDYIRSLRN